MENWMSNILAVIVLFNVFVILNCENIDESQYEKNNVELVNICSACKCYRINITNGIEKLEVFCANMVEGVAESDSFVWPAYEENLRIDVLFENLPWTSLQKLPGSKNIQTLSINNNAIKTIWPGAFSALVQLKYLQLSGNQLSTITQDVFEGLDNLFELDLSNNKLSDFNNLDFVSLRSLRSLNLANNLFTKIPVGALQELTSLEMLNLSGNQIYFLNVGGTFGESTWIKNLKYFDLSSNKLSTIYFKDTFEKAEHLEYLNLSCNAIATIENNVFQDVKSLKALDLSYNALTDLPDLNPSVEMLYLQLNAFKNWPNLPDSIRVLDLSKNNLYENFNSNYLSFDNLMFLNISGNSLADFQISKPLVNLKVLDISYNSVSSISESLNIINLPNLEELFLDGNPMRDLRFSSGIQLRKLSAKYLNSLESLDASGFANVFVRPESDNNGDHLSCLDLVISHCDNLKVINENTFQGLKLCHLDISHNKLNKLSENVAEWDNISGGVNLQGNPWDCSCHLQWLLDVILNDLYTHHPTYLHELRCAAPRLLRGMRLVHWYDRKEKSFCTQTERLSNYVLLENTENNSGTNLLMGGGSSVIVILVAIVVALVLCVALIVYLIRGKYRHNQAVRRQMMKKRQVMTDAKIMNRLSQRQNVPLNV